MSISISPSKSESHSPSLSESESESHSPSKSPSASESHSESYSESGSESESASASGVNCAGCGGADPPKYVTVDFSGITDGSNCFKCDEANTSVECTLSSNSLNYCVWVAEINDGDAQFNITVTVGYNGSNYFCGVTLHATNNTMNGQTCPYANDIYWEDTQATPYGCSGLSVYPSFVYDESEDGGCSGSGTSPHVTS